MKKILLLTNDSQRLHQWQQWLANGQMSVETTDHLSSFPLQTVDCIVTDRNIVPELAGEGLAGEGLAGEGLAGKGPQAGLQETGLIVIGAAGFGDVQLAEDCADQLPLACRLLAEVTRLRRQNKRQARLSKLFETLADTDPLTQLANRRSFDKFLTHPLRARNLVLTLFDLDAFKRINEESGYRHGDEVIRIAAQALRDTLPHAHFLGRWGGDEFIAILSSSHPETEIETWRQQWVESMHARGVPMSGSAGWSPFTKTGTASLEREFSQAEHMLRQAKRR